MSEAQSSQEVKRNPLVEKIGKDKARWAASVALAAAGFLGISGKPNSGVGLGVEVPNPNNGEAVSVGVMLASSEGGHPLGYPGAIFKDFNWDNLEVFQVSIGGAKLAVYKADILKGDGSVVKTVGVYPGFETTLGK